MTLKYKNYTGTIRLDEDAEVFHGEVLGIVDVVTFEGKTADEVVQAFKDSVDDYLGFCEERGEEPDKPYSGRFVVRMPPWLHRQAAMAAEEAGGSLNSWIVRCVEYILEENALVGAREGTLARALLRALTESAESTQRTRLSRFARPEASARSGYEESQASPE